MADLLPNDAPPLALHECDDLRHLCRSDQGVAQRTDGHDVARSFLRAVGRVPRLSLAPMRNELLPPSLVREGDFLMLRNGFRAELQHDLRSPTTTFLETRRLGTCPRSG